MRFMSLCVVLMAYLAYGPLFTEAQPNPNRLDCSNVAGQNGTFLMNIAHTGDPPLYSFVYCEDSWMIILRRQDGSVNFGRTWDEYKAGFGDLDGELWAGNELVHRVTNRLHSYELRVELEIYNGTQGFAEYGIFSVGPEESDYILTVGGFFDRDVLENSLSYHNGHPFSTWDNDNTAGCATASGVGWWFDNCQRCMLTGRYGEYPTVPEHMGITWRDPWGSTIFGKIAIMKIRRQ